MRTIVIALTLLALAGCQPEEISRGTSQGFIENVQVEESLDTNAGQHLINVSFDYRIEPFREKKNSYFCTVQFIHKELGKSFTSLPLALSPCEFDKAEGTMSVIWPGPLDNRSVDTLNANLLRLPVQYFVAIHEYTDKPASIIIARSKTMKSAINSQAQKVLETN
jgi:hypothetical protein